MSQKRACKDCGEPLEFGQAFCLPCRIKHARGYMGRPELPPAKVEAIKLADPDLCARIRAFAAEQECRPAEALTYIVNRFFAQPT